MKSDAAETTDDIDRLAKVARRANQVAGSGSQVADDHPWDTASARAKDIWRDTVRSMLEDLEALRAGRRAERIDLKLKQTTIWRRFWRWLTTRQTCRECGLLQVEAESVECRCDWPNGLRGY